MTVCPKNNNLKGNDMSPTLYWIVFLLAEITLLIDWKQTRYISNHPEKFFEVNKFLGPHPSILSVDSYFTAWVVCTAAFAYLTQDYKISDYVLVFIAAGEFIVTFRNKMIGIPVQFK
jgi:hypothetical protein